MLWQFMPTLCVLNAKIHILVAVKTALRPWMNHKTRANLSQKNLSAQIAVISQFRIVRSMAKISLNSNANFVVLQLSGFAGVILISVNLVISVNAMGIMWVSIRRTSCLNVKVQENVQLEGTTMEMEKRRH